MSAFEIHRQEIVKDYLQTVFVIDDGAYLGGIAQDIEAVKDPDQNILLDPDPDDWNEGLDKEEGSNSHSLDALELTNAFYKSGIVPGLYKPIINDDDKPEKIASNIINVSKNSDVIIIDWMLKKNKSIYSKEIIKNIIKDDIKDGGRLRSIIVYTGESGLHEIGEELFDYLDGFSLRKDGPYRLLGDGLIIELYCKEKSGSVDRDKSEAQLPNIVINSFSMLLNGLAPSFAIRSASEIRKNIGRLTAKFSHKIDAGYLTHRSLLPSPEDAELFMLEIFVSHLRSLLAISKPDIRCLGIEAIEKWVDKNQKYLCKEVEASGAKFSFTKERIIEILKDGFHSEDESKGLRKILLSTPDQNNGDQNLAKARVKKLLDKNNLHELFSFFSESGDSLDSIKELAVLSLFKRTRTDIFEDLPYLTQGTVVYCLGTEQYLLCVTPKCDTVRLSGKRSFAFAPLKEVKSGQSRRFDLVVRNRNLDGYISLTTQNKFHNLRTLEFAPELSSGRVQCQRNQSRLDFLDTADRKYQWIGDLEEMQAQSRVVGIVGDLSRNGVDEMEWLRQQ